MGLYRDVIFPHLLDFVMSRPNMMEQRARTLDESHGDVLEIGFGTGLNLEYYPEAVKQLTVLDPARMLPKRVNCRIAAARMPIEKAYLDAEQLPFDTKRFDVVVSTWTLCTIPDVATALDEVRRVLKPGGKLLFIEHGRSDDRRVARRQDRYNGVQKIIGVGCNMNRPIDRLIHQAGFEMDHLERYLMPKSPRMLAELYRGAAVVP
jgi:ubiquinone/menaquinone biosynthesis C-methylase UbiE